MNYDEIIAVLESGSDLDSWQEVSGSEMLEDRLVAMRQLQARYEQKARILNKEQEELSRLLASSA
ncbi:MAG: hypothetical protein LBH56_01605 [Coriobacteriales bacterium]|jgi:hypothetical protein|nr:hypothetical protein [Coriobacteriales bacterium]